MHRVVVIVYVRCVVMSSHNDILFFVVVVRCLFECERFKQTKYIQSKTRNQINDRQYVVELARYSMVSIESDILVTIVISNMSTQQSNV